MEPVLDHEQSHVMNRDRGLLNRIGGIFNDNPTSEDSAVRRGDAQDELIPRARPTWSQRAKEHTTFVLTGMLKSMGFEKIDIVFEQTAASV